MPIRRSRKSVRPFATQPVTPPPQRLPRDRTFLPRQLAQRRKTPRRAPSSGPALAILAAFFDKSLVSYSVREAVLPRKRNKRMLIIGFASVEGEPDA
jgi:hypothetical protein